MLGFRIGSCSVALNY